MSKCGKSCMPECEYFTTGGCISPFNCPYKIETGYINSATSIPTYMEQYNGMSDDDIERCLERFATCKTTDVMNFDYAGTLAYIKRLKSENADLRERLGKAVELQYAVGNEVFIVVGDEQRELEIKKAIIEQYFIDDMLFSKKFSVKVFLRIGHTKHIEYVELLKSRWFLSYEEAEARLAELKGE